MNIKERIAGLLEWHAGTCLFRSRGYCTCGAKPKDHNPETPDYSRIG
jgi:hypothetical protein